MKILYGVVGEGMGHAMRSRVVIQHLIEEGHQVAIMASSRAVDYLTRAFRDMEEVTGVNRIHGMFMITEENRVRMGKTILLNALRGAAALPQQIDAYFELLEDMEPEVVISDFESWTHLYGESNRLPVFCLDNMHIIHRCSHSPEITEGEHSRFEVTKAFIKTRNAFAEHYFITTFFYPPIRKERTSLYPPILRPEILNAPVSRGDHLLVYQTAEGYSALTEALARCGFEVRIYGMRRDLKEEQVEGNLRYRPFSETQFIEDLASSRGVVASAGFTLMGECVYLHKPLLAVPLAGQFEQTLNARYLEYEGYGRHASEIDDGVLRRFIEALPACEEKLAGFFQEGNMLLFNALDEHLDRAAAGFY